MAPFLIFRAWASLRHHIALAVEMSSTHKNANTSRMWQTSKPPGFCDLTRHRQGFLPPPSEHNKNFVLLAFWDCWMAFLCQSMCSGAWLLSPSSQETKLSRCHPVPEQMPSVIPVEAAVNRVCSALATTGDFQSQQPACKTKTQL